MAATGHGGFWYWVARVGFAGPMVSGMEIQAFGVERLPAGGAVLVCNHACDADPGVLMRGLPIPLSFLAAPFMGRLPVFRTLLRWAGSVAIGAQRPVPWRAQVRALLGRGRKLVVFPEGQRWLLAQDFEAGLAEFHPGFAAFAHDARVPVVPLVIARLETKIVPFRTSAIVRRLSGNPEELLRTKQVLRYLRCAIHVLDPIPVSAFAERPKNEAVPWLMEEACSRMADALPHPTQGASRTAT